MKQSLLPVLLSSLTIACHSQEQFASDFAEVSCELYEDCEVLDLMEDFEDLDSCLSVHEDEYGPGGTECTEFDPASQEVCLEEILLMSCDDLYSGVWPETCDEVCN